MEVITKSHLENFTEKMLRNDKELNDKKANYHNTNISIKDYEKLKVGDDWSVAISKAVEDLAVGGILHFPKGTYKTKELFPTNKLMTITGAGYNNSIIQYTGVASEGAFIDIRTKGFSIKDIGIYGSNSKSGNQIVGQNCSGIWIREDINGNPTGEQVIDNVIVRFFPVDGIKIFSKVWMVLFDKIRAYHNGNFGINIAGTDNTFSNLQCEGNGIRGLSVTGGNNRILNVNCIFNGKDSVDGCEGYFSTWHLSLSNVVCQDAFHHGFIFDNCTESTIDVIADCCGYATLELNEADNQSSGVKFINKCKNVIGSVHATNYRNTQTQLYGLYVDSSCYNMDLKYSDVSLSKNGSCILSNMNNRIISCEDRMYEKYNGCGKTINNIMISKDFSSSDGYNAAPPSSTLEVVGGDVAKITIDGTAQYNKFVQLKSNQVENHVYYHRVTVKADNDWCSISLFNNNSSTTPNSVNVNKQTIPNDGEWHTYSWVTQNSGTSTTFFITLGYTGDGNGVSYAKQPMCVDLTEDLGIVYNSTKEEVTSFNTNWVDKIINNVGWFENSTTI